MRSLWQEWCDRGSLGDNCKVPRQDVGSMWEVATCAKASLVKCQLSGPISRDIAIASLRYPLSRDTLSAIAAIPQEGAIPPLVLSLTQTYQCDTPFCNISRDTCAISQENKHDNILRYYRSKYRAIWKVSLLGLLLSQKVLLFFVSEVIFKDPPEIPFKTSTKINSRGCFLRVFLLPREAISKNRLKRFLGSAAKIGYRLTSARNRLKLAKISSSWL